MINRLTKLCFENKKEFKRFSNVEREDHDINYKTFLFQAKFDIGVSFPKEGKFIPACVFIHQTPCLSVFRNFY